MAARRGFTLIETLLLVVVLGVVSAIVLPPIGRMRAAAGVHNARHAVVSNIQLAKATAIRYGRPTVLRLDSDADRTWIVVDTTLAGAGVLDTLGFLSLSSDFVVDLKSNRPAICFNSRGVGTTSAICPAAGTIIIISRADKADTVGVNPLGRVFE